MDPRTRHHPRACESCLRRSWLVAALADHLARARPHAPALDGALGRGLSAAGVTVVSGMAMGIDSAAHAGALERGERTVAVLAGGADVPYPASKGRLYARLRETAAVASELPPGFRARRWCFPARNR